MILVVIGGVFLYQRGTELGADELPSSIGGGEREDIQESIQRFYGFVNQYNPEFIASAILPVPELGDEEYSRLVMSVSAIKSEKLTFDVGNLGSTTLDSEAKVVHARVATNYGVRELNLTRRDGQWEVAAVPDLLVPQEAGAVRVEWAITNSFVADPTQQPSPAPAEGQPAPTAQPTAAPTGQPALTPTARATPPPQPQLVLVGDHEDPGDPAGYLLSAAGYITDGRGATVATVRPPQLGNPCCSIPARPDTSRSPSTCR